MFRSPRIPTLHSGDWCDAGDQGPPAKNWPIWQQEVLLFNSSTGCFRQLWAVSGCRSGFQRENPQCLHICTLQHLSTYGHGGLCPWQLNNNLTGCDGTSTDHRWWRIPYPWSLIITTAPPLKGILTKSCGGHDVWLKGLSEDWSHNRDVYLFIWKVCCCFFWKS